MDLICVNLCNPWLCHLLALGWFLLADARADFERHLAGLLVSVDDDVVAVQDFAVEDLQRQRILHQLLDGSASADGRRSSGRSLA